MLWTVVYEFFVKYIFGGYLYVNGSYVIYYANMGVQLNNRLEAVSPWQTRSAIYPATFLGDSSVYYSLGNYLSLIATIISMVVIVLLCCMLIKKIYNICAHIIG